MSLRGSNFANFATKKKEFRGNLISRMTIFLRISRELNFADFAFFSRISRISSCEILFPRKFKLAKIKTLKVITARHRKTPQNTARHRKTPQDTARHPQDTARHCKTPTRHCKGPQERRMEGYYRYSGVWWWWWWW